jgi:L-cysteine:1D-myo-inositol 2-amino-2-deoxy-alpha-D-glucopyranoside ligase
MSKSKKNLVFVGDLLKEFDPTVVRVALSSHHYRTSLDWTDAVIREAEERVARWRAAGEGTAALDEVRSALDDDLNVPGAYEALDSAARRGGGVSEAAELLGLAL